MSAPVIISTSYGLDAGQWQLFATSYSRTEPAGPRLFRAAPWPEIAFTHDDEAAANKDAAKLREYLDAIAAKRGPSKAKLRKMGAD